MYEYGCTDVGRGMGRGRATCYRGSQLAVVRWYGAPEVEVSILGRECTSGSLSDFMIGETRLQPQLRYWVYSLLSDSSFFLFLTELSQSSDQKSPSSHSAASITNTQCFGQQLTANAHPNVMIAAVVHRKQYARLSAQRRSRHHVHHYAA
jgi:hypothetical protein